MRSNVWRAKGRPNRSRRIRCRAPTLRTPILSRPTLSLSSPCSSPGGSRYLTRRARSTRTRLAVSRRRANASALDDDASSQWESSTATRTGPRSASRSSTPRTATANARRSTGSPDSRRSATSSARRRGAGSSGRTSSRTFSNRSNSPTLASDCSASAGRAARTWNPRTRASSRPAAQSIDFPMPASPSSTRAAGPSVASSRNEWSEPSSASLPMISIRSLLRRS